MPISSKVRMALGVLGTTALVSLSIAQVYAHGDVAPQPVDTTGLPELGDEWLYENPYREAGDEVYQNAIRIGASGYNQNCARCHGLEAISGGLAPDLRYLSADFDGDEWYVERFVNGYTQNGITKMPAFGELLGQEAAWAIRSYVETRPDDGALDAFTARLKTIRDDLRTMADKVEAGNAQTSDFEEQLAAYKTEMTEIAGQVENGSGAPIADSPAARAASALNGSEDSLTEVVEILTVGLSAAQ